MNQFSTFPFIRFTIFLGIGITLYYYFPVLEHQLIFPLWTSSVFIYGFLFNFRKHLKNPVLLGLAGSIFLISSGYFLMYLNTDTNNPQHYAHKAEKLTYYEVIMDNLVEEKEKSWKTVGRIRSAVVDNEILPLTGKVLLYFDNESVEKPKYGDVFFVKGNLQKISQPKNPEEFDYQRFMLNQNVICQQYLRAENIEKTGNEPPEILINYSLRINAQVDSILTTFVEGKNQYGVANAMILGQRDDISNDLMQAYSAAGAIHVLSVSGLHVGVIYAVLFWMLGFLNKKGRRGKIILFWSIFIILWSYAFITGLSSPVLRSTIMFSIFLFAQIFQKNKNAYNTTAFSAFCLLLYNPYFLFNVGFQLSYLAVFGMIFFQPLLNPIFIIDKNKNWFYWLADRTWKVTTVAVAAQIATFPITIYYFHQFPNYFLFANPLVILLSSVVLMYGLAFAILAEIWLQFDLIAITNFFGQGLKYTISWLNETVLFFEKLPLSITKFLWITTYEMWLLYGLIFGLIALWRTRKYSWVWINCGIVGNLNFLNIHEKIQERNQELCTILSTPKHSTFSIIQNKKAYLIADKAFLDSRKDIGFRVSNYWASRGVRDTTKVSLLEKYQNINNVVKVQSTDSIAVITWKTKTFLWVGKNLKHHDFNAKNVSVDYLILANKSVKDLNQIIGKVQFDNLVIDASYTRWYADKLANQAEKMGIKYFDLSRSGALQIE
jgi:competence protein ComEC